MNTIPDAIRDAYIETLGAWYYTTELADLFKQDGKRKLSFLQNQSADAHLAVVDYLRHEYPELAKCNSAKLWSKMIEQAQEDYKTWCA